MTQSQTQARETQPVVVAAVDLTWGTSLTGDMIKVVPYLKESLPPGYFSDAAAVIGRTIIYPVKANEPIFESKLAPTTVAMGGVAALVTPKKRAMAVKVDKFVGVSGFIHPGNRVDVLVTLSKASAARARRRRSSWKTSSSWQQGRTWRRRASRKNPPRST